VRRCSASSAILYFVLLPRLDHLQLEAHDFRGRVLALHLLVKPRLLLVLRRVAHLCVRLDSGFEDSAWPLAAAVLALIISPATLGSGFCCCAAC
jgi:hypothetical protein